MSGKRWIRNAPGSPKPLLGQRVEIEMAGDRTATYFGVCVKPRKLWVEILRWRPAPATTPPRADALAAAHALGVLKGIAAGRRGLAVEVLEARRHRIRCETSAGVARWEREVGLRPPFHRQSSPERRGSRWLWR
jgi:hypothetical protein